MARGRYGMDPKAKNMKYNSSQEYRLKKRREKCFELNIQLDRVYDFIMELDNVITQIEQLIQTDPQKNHIYSANLDIIRRERGLSMSEFKHYANTLDIEFGMILLIMDEKQFTNKEIDRILINRKNRKDKKLIKVI